MNKYEKKAYRQIAKTEKFLRKLSKRIRREIFRLAKHNIWEDGNDDFDCPFITLESMLGELQEGEYDEAKE